MAPCACGSVSKTRSSTTGAPPATCRREKSTALLQRGTRYPESHCARAMRSGFRADRIRLHRVASRRMIIKSKEHCKWDLVALGEVMLRFDPGDGRISTARRFDVYEGGGEYNVARGLKRCFGLDTAIVTAFVDNPVGRLLQDLIYQGGVDQSLVKWVGDDGVGTHRAQRPQFHRARLRRARRARMLGSRPHRGFAIEAGRNRLGRDLRQTRRSLVPHRRHLRALSETTPDVAAEAMQSAQTAWRDRFLRSQLSPFVVESHWRAKAAHRRSTGGWPRWWM